MTIDLVGCVSQVYQNELIRNGRTNLDRVTVLLTCLGLCETNCSDGRMARLQAV